MVAADGHEIAQETVEWLDRPAGNDAAQACERRRKRLVHLRDRTSEEERAHLPWRQHQFVFQHRLQRKINEARGDIGDALDEVGESEVDRAAQQRPGAEDLHALARAVVLVGFAGWLDLLLVN